MNLLRNVRKSSLLIKLAQQNQGTASFFCNTSRHFSTEARQPRLEISQDSFLEPPSTGLVFGRLTGIRKHTTKSDIVNLLDSSGLSLEDVKADYNRYYFPMAMLVQFPSPQSYDAAIRPSFSIQFIGDDRLIATNGIKLNPMMEKLSYCKEFLVMH